MGTAIWIEDKRALFLENRDDIFPQRSVWKEDLCRSENLR